VTFKWKDYRNKGKEQHQTMTLSADEFIRRFLIHTLPLRFHRIRHIGLLANARRKKNIALVRQLLAEQEEKTPSETISIDALEKSDSDGLVEPLYQCPECGAPMVVIEIFVRGLQPRAPPIGLSQS